MQGWSRLAIGSLLAFLLAWTGELRAADPATKPAAATKETASKETLTYAPQWPEPPNTGAMLLRLCLGTAFVLALCVGSLWFAKPWLQKLQGAGTTGGPAMQIEASVALGNRAMLYLVKVGDTKLVAGTDPTGLKSLIALPASFKDVLEEQLPAEAAAIPAVDAVPSPFELRLASGIRSQEGAA